MANAALSTTIGGKSVAYLQYTPTNTSKQQPCIIFLHGAGELGDSTTTSVRTLEQSGHGIFTLTASADLPGFVDPITGETFHYYMLGPQLRTDETGDAWLDSYILKMIELAKAIPTVNPNRIYLTGLSLGCGGSITGLGNTAISNQIAAMACACPGYGNQGTTILPAIAKSGVPIWLVHAENDTTTNPCSLGGCNPPTKNHGGELLSDQLVRRINSAKPLVSPKYYRYADGGHGIWYRLYDITEGDTYPMNTGVNCVHNPGFFRWLLQYQRRDNIAPYYP